MSYQDEVREILNQTRITIAECRVAQVQHARKEIEIEELAKSLGVPVVDVEDWLEFMARTGRA